MLDPIPLQGTKILEDREVRHRFYVSAKGAPPQHGTVKIIKYTGTLATPEWKDADPGRVFGFPCYLIKSAQSQKDEFETLCRVKVDISSTPYTSKLMETGKTAYERRYQVILLVGLTELKARASWIDSETVRAHLILRVPIYLIRFPCVNLGGRDEVCSKDFRVPP